MSLWQHGVRDQPKCSTDKLPKKRKWLRVQVVVMKGITRYATFSYQFSIRLQVSPPIQSQRCLLVLIVSSIITAVVHFIVLAVVLLFHHLSGSNEQVTGLSYHSISSMWHWLPLMVRFIYAVINSIICRCDQLTASIMHWRVYSNHVSSLYIIYKIMRVICYIWVFQSKGCNGRR